MSRVQQLSSNNFNVTQRNSKSYLNVNIQDIVLIFFKMDNCEGCKAFEPIFHHLSKEEKSIEFANINISNNRNVASLSRQTTTPITSVPYLLLFFNGVPYAKYNGKRNIQNLKSFINKIVPTLASNNRNNRFMPNNSSQFQNNNQPQNNYQNYQTAGANTKIDNNQHVDRGLNEYEIKDVDNEDDSKLLIPSMVIPYNVPWEVSYKKMKTFN